MCDSVSAFVGVKRCCRCGINKEYSEFYKNRIRNDGYHDQCKECFKGFNLASKDRIAAYKKEYHEKNKISIHAKKVEYYKENSEHIKQKTADYMKSHKKERLIYVRKYRELNRDRISQYHREYRESNREQILVTKRNRTARIRSSEGSHTLDDIKTLLSLQKKKCAVCHVSIKNGYHVDHIIASVNGGSNDKYNLQLLCPTCNLSKHSKHPIDFMQERGMLL